MPERLLNSRKLFDPHKSDSFLTKENLKGGKKREEEKRRIGTKDDKRSLRQFHRLAPQRHHPTLTVENTLRTLRQLIAPLAT
jgi:hypothetical protein